MGYDIQCTILTLHSFIMRRLEMRTTVLALQHLLLQGTRQMATPHLQAQNEVSDLAEVLA